MTRDRMGSTLNDFDTDWAHVAPPGHPVPESWLVACPSLSAATDFPDVLRLVRATPDEVLLALLRLHRDGDVLAGRMVLQAMLPKAVRISLRDREASLADVLAVLWECICVYPIERRPRRVAANLALDTLKGIVASRDPALVVDDVRVPADDPEPDAAHILDAGLQLGFIDAQTRRTLECVYVGGHSSRSAAAELGMSRDMVRWRCSRGVRALRTHKDELVELLAS